jgi:hypothetical protein
MGMSYTLMKGLGWFLAAFLLGVLIGWMLRSVTARRQLARARQTAVETNAVPAAPAADTAPTPILTADIPDALGDDLKVIPGIGANVEELCHGIGIRTWSNLSVTEVSLLRTMLADAGPRFRAVDPSAWPELAGLLADGRMEEFERRAAAVQSGPLVE